MAKSQKEQLDSIEKKIEQLKARKQLLERKEQEKKRKRETHDKIVIGGAIYGWVLTEKEREESPITKEEATELAKIFGDAMKAALKNLREQGQPNVDVKQMAQSLTNFAKSQWRQR